MIYSSIVHNRHITLPLPYVAPLNIQTLTLMSTREREGTETRGEDEGGDEDDDGEAATSSIRERSYPLLMAEVARAEWRGKMMRVQSSTSENSNDTNV